MSKKREKKISIENLPQPPEELSPEELLPEQAEKAKGGSSPMDPLINTAGRNADRG